jgi:hypothetical protein
MRGFTTGRAALTVAGSPLVQAGSVASEKGGAVARGVELGGVLVRGAELGGVVIRGMELGGRAAHVVGFRTARAAGDGAGSGRAAASRACWSG